MQDKLTINDNFRREIKTADIVWTATVAALRDSILLELEDKVQSFKGFEPNDTEHNFGIVTCEGFLFQFEILDEMDTAHCCAWKHSYRDSSSTNKCIVISFLDDC